MSGGTARAKRNPYGLVRPCPDCPFRTDVRPYLRFERAKEIAASIRDGGEFHCHKTTVSDDQGGLTTGPGSMVCAGAIATMMREQQPNQMLRIAERIGLFDPERLDAAARVHDSLTAWVRSYAEPTELEHCDVVADQDCEDPPGFSLGGGVAGNDDDPQCDPEISCQFCGHVMCTSCRGRDLDGYPVCRICEDDL